MFEQRESRLNERTSDAASSLSFHRLQVAFSLPGVSRLSWLLSLLLLAAAWSAEAVEGLKLQSLTSRQLTIEWTAPSTNSTD